MAISFHSAHPHFKPHRPTLLRRWLHASAHSHGVEIRHLSFIFVPDDALLEMNRNYLRHDTYTDILTFDLSDQDLPGIRGEVYISVDRITENAQKYGVTFQHELMRVMAHGLLHLIGFKDKTNSQKSEMSLQEDATLALPQAQYILSE